MEWKFLLIVAAITLVAIGLAIYAGIEISNYVRRQGPESEFVRSRLTLTGTALYACMVGSWLVCLLARESRPESSLGAIVGTADGLITVIVASIFFIVVVGVILQKLGYQSFKRTDPNLWGKTRKKQPDISNGLRSGHL